MLLFLYSFSVESIVGGSIGTAEVKITGFLFRNKTYDLCGTAMHNVGLKCPVAAGKYSINMTTPIPVETPRVSSYNIIIKLIVKH